MIVTLGLRVAQLLFSAIVLILSVVLVKGYGPGHAPTILDYGATCGGAAIIVAAVGVISLFIDRLQGIIMLGLDAFATFFLLAGAAAFAAKVRSGDCTRGAYVQKIYSTITVSDDKSYNTDNPDTYVERFADDIISRCRMAQADTAFLWILVLCFVGTITLAFLSKSGKRGGAIV